MDTPQVHRGRKILSECRQDVEDTVFDVRVASVIDISFKFTVISTIHGKLMLPNLVIKKVEVLLKDKMFYFLFKRNNLEENSH